MSIEERKIIRKRIVGCVLATDMAKHFKELGILKQMISDNDISEGENVSKLIDGVEEVKKFEN